VTDIAAPEADPRQIADLDCNGPRGEMKTRNLARVRQNWKRVREAAAGASVGWTQRW
jgi:hypothetical protein